MAVYRISPSKIESFRKYVIDAYGGFFTKEKIINMITGVRETSEALEFGTAYHAIIEHGADQFWDEEKDHYVIQIDDMTKPVMLSQETAQAGIVYRANHPNMIHEVPERLVIPMGSDTVIMHMRIDGVEGRRLHEIKTSSRTPSLSDYDDSLQWKCYLLATQEDMIQYDIFSISKKRVGEAKYNTFRFWKYPGMEQAVYKYLHGIIDFAKLNGLEEYLLTEELVAEEY